MTDDHDESEQQSYQYYTSEKVLGKLYRAIDERSIWKNDVHSVATTDGPSFWDQFLQWADGKYHKLGGFSWQEREEEAQGIRSA